MPGYSSKAQPFLDAIAAGVFASQEIRDWLIRGTPVEEKFIGSNVLIDEQRTVRWRTKPTKQPFWANYWCGRDTKCTCRLKDSKAIESDAIFFFRNSFGRILAVHVEFKHPNETFSIGQPEAYPLRAACFVKTCGSRATMNRHDEWTTIIFCGPETLSDARLSNFQRVITHSQAAEMLGSYPAIR